MHHISLTRDHAASTRVHHPQRDCISRITSVGHAPVSSTLVTVQIMFTAVQSDWAGEEQEMARRSIFLQKLLESHVAGSPNLLSRINSAAQANGVPSTEQLTAVEVLLADSRCLTNVLK